VRSRSPVTAIDVELRPVIVPNPYRLLTVVLVVAGVVVVVEVGGGRSVRVIT
jgi:hypothetical protein